MTQVSQRLLEQLDLGGLSCSVASLEKDKQAALRSQRHLNGQVGGRREKGKMRRERKRERGEEEKGKGYTKVQELKGRSK